MNTPNKKARATTPSHESTKVAKTTAAKETANSSATSKSRIPLKTKIQIVIVAAVILALCVYVAWDIITGGPLTQLFQNREELTAIIRSWGILAPIAYLALQVAQTVFAPIPGNVVGLLGGAIFGWWGIPLIVLGSACGYWIVFVASRKFGRPLVEKVVGPQTMQKLDFILNKNAEPILFLIFLIPGLPDDVVAYVAGLTKIPIKKLMAMSVLGRFPSVVVTNYLGMGIAGSADTRVAIALAVITVIVLAIILWQKDRIMAALRKMSRGKIKSDEADKAEDRKTALEESDNSQESSDKK